jgi:hypothetical protein
MKLPSDNFEKRFLIFTKCIFLICCKLKHFAFSEKTKINFNKLNVINPVRFNFA